MMFIKVFDRLRSLHGIFIMLYIAKNRNISFLLKVYIIEYILLHIMYYTMDQENYIVNPLQTGVTPPINGG